MTNSLGTMAMGLREWKVPPSATDGVDGADGADGADGGLLAPLVHLGAAGAAWSRRCRPGQPVMEPMALMQPAQRTGTLLNI